MNAAVEEKPFTEVELQGRFDGFEDFGSSGPRFLLLQEGSRRHRIKIARRLRELLPALLQERMQVTVGCIRRKRAGGPLETWKAVFVAPLSGGARSRCVAGVIHICNKSNCWKRGGRELWERLQHRLAEEGLETQVRLQKSGCLDQCNRQPGVCWSPAPLPWSGSQDRVRVLLEGLLADSGAGSGWSRKMRAGGFPEALINL